MEYEIVVVWFSNCFDSIGVIDGPGNVLMEYRSW